MTTVAERVEDVRIAWRIYQAECSVTRRADGPACAEFWAAVAAVSNPPREDEEDE
jgi:hypothetical protein